MIAALSRLPRLLRVSLLVLPVLLGAPGPARAAGDPVVRPGYWNKGKVPKGWVVVESEHYHVQSEIGEEKARGLVEHLESVHACYEEFLPTRRKSEQFVLKMFATRKEFCEYGGFKITDGPLAYYNQSSKELVGYDTGVILGKRDIPAKLELAPDCKTAFTDKEKARLKQLFEQITDAYTMDEARILSHEGWHQYFHNYTISWVSMPSWLDEGVGDYFFTATKDEQNSDGEHGYRLGDINELRLRAVRRGLFEGSAVDFHTLLGFDQEQYYSNRGVFYAQGWSMVEFLLEHKDPAYRALIPRLIKDFKDTKNFRKSTEKVFKGFDMAALDKEWLAWLLSRPITDPFLDFAREFGDRLKPEDITWADEKYIKLYQWYLDHKDYRLDTLTTHSSDAADPPKADDADKPGKSDASDKPEKAKPSKPSGSAPGGGGR